MAGYGQKILEGLHLNAIRISSNQNGVNAALFWICGMDADSSIEHEDCGKTAENCRNEPSPRQQKCHYEGYTSKNIQQKCIDVDAYPKLGSCERHCLPVFQESVECGVRDLARLARSALEDELVA